MIDATNKAGLFKENDDIGTFFALEPEAASIYFNTQESYKNIINTEEPFILLI